ncbi:MAG: transcriptional regulator [Pseudolabrys sp.]
MLDQAIAFGNFRLEPNGGLMSGAREVRLTPKALELLSFLAGHPGQVITKDELFAAVWHKSEVGDAALVTCIQELRKALRDNARRPRYIETLHRRGYRFIGKAHAARRATAGD